jgi:Tfp pilus assembly protein PilN
MEAVNLLPAYARPGHRWATAGKDLSARRVLTVGGAVAGAAVIAIGAAFVYERSVVNDKQDTLAAVETQLAVVQAKAEPLRAAQSQSATMLGAIRTISAGRVPWENVLRDLARVMPRGIQLQTLQITSPTPIGPIGGPASADGGATTTATGFTVTGSASSQNRVALALDRLAALPWLTDVTLQSSIRGGSGVASGTAPDQFTISASFNNVTGGAR